MAETQRKGIAFDQVWKSITGVPGVSLKAHRYKAVNYNADEKTVLATAKGNAVGIVYEPFEVDQPVQIVAQGFAFCVYGAAVTAGQPLEVGSDGKLIPYTDGIIIGTAAVSADADAIGTVLLK